VESNGGVKGGGVIVINFLPSEGVCRRIAVSLFFLCHFFPLTWATPALDLAHLDLGLIVLLLVDGFRRGF
jgi:hypothetical protein